LKKSNAELRNYIAKRAKSEPKVIILKVECIEDIMDHDYNRLELKFTEWPRQIASIRKILKRLNPE
jgi:hypothetical protein